MDNQPFDQKTIDEPLDELDELMCQLPLLDPSTDFNRQVMSRIDLNLYRKERNLLQKHHSGHLLVMMGMLIMIHALTIETIQWMGHLVAERLPQFTAMHTAIRIYETIIVRMIQYVLAPCLLVVDLISRVSQDHQLWYAFGVVNLLLLLLLVHFSIQKMMKGPREGRL
ncbi:hypothetical protein SAMN05192551_102304 [Tindallia magadiensis]|uniref:Uncharacterized protein n=1 Tax=Tindallia magadiensis TaxID=69895 RepID=A0A1I3CAA7_9FIRM|nr:hypothetical protein [Tindallia magadiensis]SFH71500.1 hypothetical protein SAMN05192551_102304 [Tindallia magadiensis]